MSLPKITKKAKTKRFLGWALVFALVLFGLLKGLEFTLENQIEGLINTNEDRKYDLRYKSLNLNILTTKVKLEGVSIVPVNPDSTKSFVSASLEEAQLNGVDVFKFLTSKVLTIDELNFLAPNFLLTLAGGQESSRGSSAFQDLFKDIISRGEIKNFSMKGGNAELYLASDPSRKIGSFNNFNITASDLSTDAVQLNHAIPFQFENIHTSLESFTYELDFGRHLSFDSFDFSYADQELTILGLKMGFENTWQDQAKLIGYQTDIIDFKLGSLKFKKLSPSASLYDSLVFVSEKLELDSLVLKDRRDKNIPRPKDEIKENFAALLKKLNFPLLIDTIKITNSSVEYFEINEGSTEAGVLLLSELDATILNATSMDSLEAIRPLEIALTGKLNEASDFSLNVIENYQDLSFSVDLEVGAMSMKSLNTTLVNLASIEIKSGQMTSLKLRMDAGTYSSRNHFSIQYSGLDFDLLKKDSQAKNKLLSSVSKVAYFQSFQKGDKHWNDPSYTTKRNRYRGPINLIWLSLKEGLLKTVPRGAARALL
ncbi:hypothetical protein ACFOSV_10455 [Algoriphagus namhaensis]|uniref:DUF748 domain-containing protein n=1 Tax=Algoriphagus namhaensis TaxID=915353 RepID=A0ABV8ARH6_9BACT